MTSKRASIRSLTLLVAALGAASAAFAETFYWYGTWNATKTWADYTDPANWSLAKDEYVNSENKIPGANDYLWAGGWGSEKPYYSGLFDLKGTSQTVAGWNGGTSYVKWSNYGVGLTNGTLTVSNPTYKINGVETDVGHFWTIWNGGTLIYPKATYSYAFSPSQLDEAWWIKSGGRMEVYCSASLNGGSEVKPAGWSREKPNAITVDAGGTLIFDPVQFSILDHNHRGVDFVNNGSMQFPSGLNWLGSGTAALSSGVTRDYLWVHQNAGTMLLGGNFTKTGKNTSYEAHMEFILAGGTLEITNSVSFFTASSAYNDAKGWTNQVYATMPADATATVQVDANSIADFSLFTYGDNAILHKTGDGKIYMGTNLPSALHVNEGAVGFRIANEAINLSKFVFSAGTTISFDAPGLSLAALDNADTPNYTIGTCFRTGDTVVTAGSAELAETIAARLVLPAAYAGMTASADGCRVVLLGLPTTAETFYWNGSRSEWTSIRTDATWWTCTGGKWAVAERLPCANDLLNLYGSDSKLALLDLCGETWTFASMTPTPSRSSGAYRLGLRNGTLHFPSYNCEWANSAGDNFEIESDARVIIDGGFAASSSIGRRYSQTIWRVAGRLDLRHNFMRPLDVHTLVEPTGTYYFAPTNFALHNSSEKGFSTAIVNAGTLLAPLGIRWNGYDPWSNKGVTKTFVVTNLATGVIYLGGDFTKTLVEQTAGQPAAMKFVLAGGKIVSSNSVAFCNTVQSYGVDEVSAEMTGSAAVETAAGSTLDLGIMTFADGLTLTKTGPGTLVLGATRPANVIVTEGAIAFASAVSDFTGLTLPAETLITLRAKENDLSTLANAANYAYTVGAGFKMGETVLTAASPEAAQAICAKMTVPQYLEDLDLGFVVSGSTITVSGSLALKPRDVTVYAGDEPVANGYTAPILGIASLDDRVTGTPAYDWGGYTTAAAAGSVFPITLSGLEAIGGAVSFLTGAQLTVVDPTEHTTFFWAGGDSEWKDYGDIASWQRDVTVADTNGVAAARLPGREDDLWLTRKKRVADIADSGYIDLGGQTYEVRNLALDPQLTTWNTALFHLRNGTLRILNLTNAIDRQISTAFTIYENTRLDIRSSGSYHLGVGGVHSETWTVKNGGRLDYTGGILIPKISVLSVEAGGTACVDPDEFVPNKTCEDAYPVRVNNAGTFIAPHGFVWSDRYPGVYAATIKKFIFTQRAGATTYFGGDFRKEAAETSGAASMQLILQGGTFVASNTVHVCNLTGCSEVSASMTGDTTIEVAGDLLDVTAMTFTDGKTLTKTGSGTIRFGASLPSAAVIQAGDVAFANPVSSLDGFTLAAGTKIVFGAAENTVQLANYTDYAFAIDPANFTIGQTILTSADEDYLDYVAAQIASTLPAETKTQKDGTALKLVSDATYLYSGSGDINDPANWRGRVVPTNCAVVVAGSGTVAQFGPESPAFKSITLSEGATLEIAGGDGLVPPPLLLTYPSTLKITSGLVALSNTLACTTDGTTLPKFTVEAGAVLQIVQRTVFKNMELELKGEIYLPDRYGIVTFGGADAGETAYFEMSADGGTIHTYGHANGTAAAAIPRCFVSPASGGCVVVKKPITLKNVTFNAEDYCQGVAFGYNNPTNQPVEIVLDNTTLRWSRTVLFAGAAKVRLTNGSKVTPTGTNFHPGTSARVVLQDLATVSVEDEGSQLYISNASPNNNYIGPAVAGDDAVILKNGGAFAAHNTTGNGKGVFRITGTGGTVGVPALPYVSNDLNPCPINANAFKALSYDDKVETVRTNWMTDVFARFARVDIDAGATLTLKAEDLFVSSDKGAVTQRWNRAVKIADIPIAGAGNLNLASVTPGYSFAATIVNGANTCTGKVELDAGSSDTPRQLLFNDGANWAGDVYTENVALTNVEGADAPAAVAFGSLHVNGLYRPRVWVDAGTNDVLALAGDLVAEGGKIRPQRMDGSRRFSADETFLFATCPADAAIPAADDFLPADWTLSTETEGDVKKLYLTHRPIGLILLVK